MSSVKKELAEVKKQLKTLLAHNDEIKEDLFAKEAEENELLSSIEQIVSESKELET